MPENTNIKNPPEILRLKKRADFLRLRDGESIATKSLVLQYAPSAFGTEKVGIGFTATKKIGKATVRNRAKRRLREAIAKKYLQLKGGCDIVLIARHSTAECNWDNLVKDLDEALKKAGLLGSKG